MSKTSDLSNTLTSAPSTPPKTLTEADYGRFTKERQAATESALATENLTEAQRRELRTIVAACRGGPDTEEISASFSDCTTSDAVSDHYERELKLAYMKDVRETNYSEWHRGPLRHHFHELSKSKNTEETGPWDTTYALLQTLATHPMRLLATLNELFVAGKHIGCIVNGAVDLLEHFEKTKAPDQAAPVEDGRDGVVQASCAASRAQREMISRDITKDLEAVRTSWASAMCAASQASSGELGDKTLTREELLEDPRTRQAMSQLQLACCTLAGRLANVPKELIMTDGNGELLDQWKQLWGWDGL